MSHQHLSEEELILYYYGEDVQATGLPHLEECPECRALYGSIQRALNLADSLPVPERGEDYGSEVWRRLENRLPARRRLWAWPAPWRWAAEEGRSGLA